MVVSDFSGILTSVNKDDDASDQCTLEAQGAPCDACLTLTQAKVKPHMTPNFYGSSIDFDYRTRALKTKVNYYHDPLVHRVPVEIASQIFIAYVQGTIPSTITITATTGDFAHDPLNNLTTSTSWSAPLLLASVCHTWRAIALSTPHLWTSLHIHLTPASSLPLSTSTALTAQWQHRTGLSLPLSLTLVLPDPNPHSSVTPAALGPLFTLLRAFAPRWGRLTLRIATHYYKYLTHNLVSLPLLHSLLLAPPTDSIWSTSIHPSSFRVAHTPSLRHLKVVGISLSKVPMQYTLLSSFEATEVFIADILSLLRTAPALTRCKFTRISGSTGIFPLPSTTTGTAELITHTSLHELSIHPDGDIADKLDSLLLSRIVLPALQKLECDFSNTRDGLPDQSLCALFARSRCSLKHFSVKITEPDTRMTDTSLVRILEDLPTLTHLVISTQFSTPIFSDMLLGRMVSPLSGLEETAFLPHLETLEFTGRRTFSWASFTQLLQPNNNESGSDCSTDGRSRRPIKRIKIKLARHLADPLELLNNAARKQLLDVIGSSGTMVEIVDMAGENLLRTT